ncbi:MAG: YhcH/YjgK/YiaL family protein [Clostridia bacterium]|nr:YhcH/YjgK/YiaL family protein [Clostridia bacterium]
MILDTIKNCGLYTAGNERLAKGFEFIKEFMKNPLEVGKYEIDGENVYAVVQEYETKAPGKFESHKKYIDIQFIVSGNELIKYENISALKACTEYDAEKDFMLFDGKDDVTELILKEGMFAVFYPEDGHMPGLAVKNPENVSKIVVKVLV